jgi:hypothetical protein
VPEHRPPVSSQQWPPPPSAARAALPQPCNRVPSSTATSQPETRSSWPGRKRRRLSGASAGPGPYVPSIALRSVDGHIARTGDTVTAWYRLRPQRWSFRSDPDREALIRAIAGTYADLQGRWLHIRVTSRPYLISAWAEAHARNAIGQMPDVPSALSFDDYLIGEQRQLQGQGMANKEIYLGIEVQRRTVSDVLVEQARPLLSRVWPTLVNAELAGLKDEIDHLDHLVAGPGLVGRPVTPAEMRWLLQRSCSLGLPAPRSIGGVGGGYWASEDLAAVTEGADAWTEPYAPTVTVRARTGPRAGLERHVAVLTLGLMQPLEVPQADQPWMAAADMLPVPPEWSARIYVRRPEEVQAELLRQVQKVNSQVDHFAVEHGQQPPQQLARQADRASDIDDELSREFGLLHTRVQGWWRLAVSGSSRREALKIAQAVLELYKPKIAVEHPEAQYAMWREFIPGEPLASRAYVRRGSVTWAASAVPTATADVGDRRGILLGETVGTARRPVAWDPWMAQEIRNQSGLTAILAGLGGGKSFLGGGIVYKTLRAGAHWTLLDPSGPLARLCELPELRPFSRVINLLAAEPGILNPYRVVPEPLYEDYIDEPDPQKAWNQARVAASATRRRLCRDVLQGVLPHAVAQKPETQIVLTTAVRTVGGDPTAHPGMVIKQLLRDNTEHRNHARNVHAFLDELADQLTLLIPETDADPYAITRDDRLTVLTMPGLVLPRDGVPREHWTDAEALGVELLNLAAWLTQRSVYEKPKDQRKGVWIDEAFFLSEVPTGRVLMNRFARDSRKWNVRVLLSSQIPADFLKIQGFVALLDSVFVGRLSDHEVQADALRLLKVPVGVGYEGALATLAHTPGAAADLALPGDGDNGATQRLESDREPRQFIFNDGAGGIDRIRVDFSGPHLTHLRAALDTTPGQAQDHTPAIQARLHRPSLPASPAPAEQQAEPAFVGDLDAFPAHRNGSAYTGGSL